ncbi:1-deoxypentalenic acid 11-beta-hydroxylase-like [Watersipora subatra]|uniref:1-deoxypentalenic acid 11-beta-hydroxylase-like n=1 Tax=Watersipora subatra TaxID=2589382 RepID=UPI00355C00BE
MKVELGTRSFEFPSEDLQELEASNNLLGDVEALRSQLERTGYLYLKNFHDRQEVLEARQKVLEYINATGQEKFDDIEEGLLNERCGLGCVPFMEGKPVITHSDAARKVLEGQRPFKFFQKLFGQDVATFDYKWLRAMHKRGFTGAHVDNVYMSRGTDKVLTMWTPFSDITPDIGTLAVCEGSNQLNSFDKFQKTYGQLDVEAAKLNGTGWFTEDPWEISKQFGGVWKTANYEAGDVLIFTLRTVHMSTVNLTSIARISCDTRWQPKDAKRDMRYFDCKEETDSPQFGVWAKDSTVTTTHFHGVTIEELKHQWGM